MQRIIDPTAVASLPTPPALTGVSGYFTEGSPGVTPATDVRGWWLDMMQEEFMSFLAAAGITPDTTATNFNQVLKSSARLFSPTGQCRLSVSSSTALLLQPYNGNIIKIAGATYQIPSAGSLSAIPGWRRIPSITSMSLMTPERQLCSCLQRATPQTRRPVMSASRLCPATMRIPWSA